MDIVWFCEKGKPSPTFDDDKKTKKEKTVKVTFYVFYWPSRWRVLPGGNVV